MAFNCPKTGSFIRVSGETPESKGITGSGTGLAIARDLDAVGLAFFLPFVPHARSPFILRTPYIWPNRAQHPASVAETRVDDKPCQQYVHLRDSETPPRAEVSLSFRRCWQYDHAGSIRRNFIDTIFDPVSNVLYIQNHDPGIEIKIEIEVARVRPAA